MKSRSRHTVDADSERSVERVHATTKAPTVERRRATSATKAPNRTSTAVELSDVTMARCRSSPYRSRQRAAMPASQCRRVSSQMPTARAAAAKLSPSRSLESAPITISTPVTLPGSASQGRTRSRR